MTTTATAAWLNTARAQGWLLGILRRATQPLEDRGIVVYAGPLAPVTSQATMGRQLCMSYQMTCESRIYLLELRWHVGAFEDNLGLSRCTLEMTLNAPDAPPEALQVLWNAPAIAPGARTGDALADLQAHFEEAFSQLSPEALEQDLAYFAGQVDEALQN